MRGGVRIKKGNANIKKITNGRVVRRKNIRTNGSSHRKNVFGHMNNYYILSVDFYFMSVLLVNMSLAVSGIIVPTVS